MTTSHGLILNPQEKHHWVQGSGKATKKLGADAGEINPSGDWTKWAPSEELQNRYGFETQACVSFAILKAIITLAKFKGYEIPHNLSERYTAYVTGTTLDGNDPWKVAEQTATQFGVVAEDALPWSDSIRDWMGFYAGIDEPLVALGQTILRKYEIEPEWVIPPINAYTVKEKQERIKRALKRGTVVASVRAWDKNGRVYVKDAGAPDNHLVFLPKHGEASDQYEPFKKKLDPIYDHQAAIVFFMRPNPTGVAPFERNYLLTLLQKALGALKRLLARPPAEIRVDVPAPPVLPIVEPPKPAPAPRLTNREHLYQVAKSCIGKDMAKTQNELGCAESVNAVHKLAFGKEIGGGPSTALMLKALVKHPDFTEVTSPLPGDIAMNATGTSTKQTKNGHVGIWGKTHVMSNNSATYKWDTHYPLAYWKEYFERRLGFPTRYFRRTGVRN